jgi:hypothetical protein
LAAPAISAENLIEQAQAVTGIAGFDSDSLCEGLDILVSGIAASKMLHAEGRAALTGLITGMLINRLRIAEYARQHPAILQVPVARPVIIFGLPRTGTTLLSHLLAADPNRRSLLRWEAYDSAPPATQETLTTDPRCLAMKLADQKVATPPELHLESADLAIECSIPLAHDFKNIMWAGLLEDPAYQNFLLRTDLGSAYRFHKLQLQVLQSRTLKKWTLKAPSHAMGLAALLRTYPDARLIWTHRDPYRALASACSVTAASRISFGQVDAQKVGPEMLRLLQAHIERPMALRAAAQPPAMFDLHYAELLRDPMGSIGAVYRWLGDRLTPEAEAAMQAWLAANPQGKFGKHEYALERFGLHRNQLPGVFADYVARYGVESEAG